MTTTLDINPYAPTMLLDTARRVQAQADFCWRHAGRAFANGHRLFHVSISPYSRLVQAQTAREWAAEGAALEFEARMLEREAWALYQERQQ